MSERTIHIWGSSANPSAAIYDGSVRDVATAVMAAIKRHGHHVRRDAITRPVDDRDCWHAVDYLVDTRGMTMRHTFTRPRDAWPVA